VVEAGVAAGGGTPTGINADGLAGDSPTPLGSSSL